MRVVVAVALGLALSGSAAAQQHRQEAATPPAVKSAQIAALPASDREITIAIKNNGSRVLEAWQFAGHYLDSSGRTRTFETSIDNYPWTTYLAGSVPPGDEGPIKPGEERLKTISATDFKSLVDVRLVFVLYDDQSREGDAVEVGHLFQRREDDAADADAILTALRASSKVAPGQAKSLLRPRTAETTNDRPALKANKRMVAALVEAADADVAKRTTDLIAYLEQKKAAALRHQRSR